MLLLNNVTARSTVNIYDCSISPLSFVLRSLIFCRQLETNKRVISSTINNY